MIRFFAKTNSGTHTLTEKFLERKLQSARPAEASKPTTAHKRGKSVTNNLSHGLWPSSASAGKEEKRADETE